MSRLWSRGVAIALALVVVLGWLGFNLMLAQAGVAGAVEALATFTTLCLSLFIEAVPFLLLGALASGLVEVYLGHEQVRRWAPRGRLAGALAGAMLGFVFPVGEGGSVVLARRLLAKGLPLSTGLTFLLAAPVFNPVTIASTVAAFGVGQVLWLRLGLTLLIAAVVGLTFAGGGRPEHALRAAASPPAAGASRPPLPALHRALTLAVDEFFAMGAWLVAGTLLAALVQTFVSQLALLALGAEPVASVAALMALAASLSIGSAVDALAALSFSGTVGTGALLAFLVAGPMVDLKCALMFFGVFRPRVAARLTLLPLVLTWASTVLLHLVMGR